MPKQTLTAQEAKKEFVKSISKWLSRTVETNDPSVKDFLEQKDSSIICSLPANFFYQYEIPDGLRIEMKFTVKR